MKHIFVDFEMHPIAKEYKEEKVICQREIIEFGAVMLDESFKEITSFKAFVQPEYVKDMYKKISILTGITPGSLAGAKKFNSVFFDFVTWCSSLDSQYTVYAWSGSVLEQILKEMTLKQTVKTPEVEYMLDNWVDFQRDYCELVKAEKLISLERALNSVGQYFTGNMHDALWDARNTADLFTVTRNQEEFFSLIESVNKIVKKENEECHSTLGDLIDFSAFCIA